MFARISATAQRSLRCNTQSILIRTISSSSSLSSCSFSSSFHRLSSSSSSPSSLRNNVAFRQFSSSVEPPPPQQPQEQDAAPQQSKLDRFLHKYIFREAIVAPEGYNRWANVPFSFMVQVSVGSVYAWSLFNGPLTLQNGVVAAASSDWALGHVVPIFSTAAVFLGITTFFMGSWAERRGPRAVALTAAACWGGGLMVTSLGCYLHALPLLYLGYGVLGGMGWGFGYISPVSTLIKWFPDRRGLATGLALSAFGGGALVATPINQWLLRRYFEAPTFLGAADAVELVTREGKRFAHIANEFKEVVVATASDLSAYAESGLSLQPGVYLVNSGNTGAAMTFFTLGAGYLCLMTVGALGQRVPREGWQPDNWTPPAIDASSTSSTSSSVESLGITAAEAVKTRQFYLLWTAVAGNAFAGVSVISCAKTMMTEVFGGALPLVVTGSFAAGYVAALSAGNMVGRLGWSSLSDYMGRKNAYYVFGLAVPIVALIPTIVAMNPGVAPLILFYGGTVLVVSFYGGMFAVLPAYIADIYGTSHVGAIHGRALTAWTAASVFGPALLTQMRGQSYTQAVHDLSTKVNPEEFQEAFGVTLTPENVTQLLEQKTITIRNVLQLAPENCPDPTSLLYDSTMYTMSGVLFVALVCNFMLGPLTQKQIDALRPAGVSQVQTTTQWNATSTTSGDAYLARTPHVGCLMLSTAVSSGELANTPSLSSEAQ